MRKIRLLAVGLVLILGVAAYTYFSDRAAKPPESVPVSAASAKESKAQVAALAKVVFLKGTALMTANVDGSDLKTLVNDGVYKTNPRWSPSGDKIVYDTPSDATNRQESTDTLVVVTTTGALVKAMPQDSGAAWWFFVDQIGWYGDNAVFLTGEVSHWRKGYLSLDIDSTKPLQKIEATTGVDFRFQTCPSKAQVAYPDDTRADDDNPSFSVMVNGSTVYTPKLPAQKSSYVLDDLLWSGDCSRLAVVETVDTSARFVVLSGTSVEARIPIPMSAGWPVVVVPVGSTFAIVSGPSGDFSLDTAALVYDTTKHTLESSPATLQQFQQREAAEKKLINALGGESPDWYRPAATGDAR